MLKFIIGTAILLALYLLTPLFDLLQLFVMVVVIPLLALLSLGLISGGAAEVFLNFVPRIVEDVKKRAQEIREASEEAKPTQA